MQQEKGVLFLYSNLPDYFYRCILHFVRTYGIPVTIIRYRGDLNAQYRFEPDPMIENLFKDEVNIVEEIEKRNPVAIFLSGWSDKDYRKAVQDSKKSRSVILGLDNPWLGTFKQKLLCLLSPIYIRSVFNKVWVAGPSQRTYAKKLGFSNNQILDYLYAADSKKFYEHPKAQSANGYPHTVIYLGRMVGYKQPELLAEVFNELASENNLNWKLVMAGEGPLKEIIRAKKYPAVEFMNFVQPSDQPDLYKNAGIFCLPSIGEHWGVAVQEAAAAGLPLLLSDSVGAASIFLKEGINGYTFKTNNKEALKLALRKMIALSDDQLYAMGQKSVEASRLIDQEKWSDSLKSAME